MILNNKYLKGCSFWVKENLITSLVHISANPVFVNEADCLQVEIKLRFFYTFCVNLRV